jgi:hypothetical protein
MAPTTTELTEYEAPRVVDFGDLVTLTAGESDWCDLESSFPGGKAEEEPHVLRHQLLAT